MHDKIVLLVQSEKDAAALNTHSVKAVNSIDELIKQYHDHYVGIIMDFDPKGHHAIFNKQLSEVKKAKLKYTLVAVPIGTIDNPIVTLSQFIKESKDFSLLYSQVEAKFREKKAEDNDGKKDKKKLASKDDYNSIVKEYFGEVKRDIFSDDLCYFDNKKSIWTACANKVRALRAYCKDLAIVHDKVIKPSDIEDYLYLLEDSSTPRFLIDIPAWDGVDRLKILSDRIVLSRNSIEKGINELVFEDLLKHWHAKTWKRLYDPSVRNEIFILAGRQLVGKDFWITENCGALGQFLISFAIHATSERDTKEQLHRGLVMNIGEFDRTNKADAALLKEIVTLTHTDIRFAYDRRAMSRKCYCSFMASCNVKDIFNDPTGHSRYVFFEIDDINKDSRFSDSDKMQVLAQGKHLANENFKPNELSLLAMKHQIEDLTPDDEQIIIIERWDSLCSEKFYKLEISAQEIIKSINNYNKYGGCFFNMQPVTIDCINILSKEFNRSVSYVRRVLGNNDRKCVHPRFGRGYYFKTTIPAFTEDAPYTI